MGYHGDLSQFLLNTLEQQLGHILNRDGVTFLLGAGAIQHTLAEGTADSENSVFPAG